MGPTSSSFTFFLCLFGVSVLFLIVLIVSALRIVPENTRLSVFRLGHYIGDKGPGVVFLIPMIDRAIRVDVNDQMQRAQAQQQMWGAIGETRTPVHADGQVEVSGQVWNAVSREPIPVSAKVRVVRVLLEVEALTT